MDSTQILYLRAMQGIYLSLGSNLGDREKNLIRAQELLTFNRIIISRASSIYETEAWGKEDQPNFLNQVLEVVTDLSPRFLVNRIGVIEKEMGRVRIEKWGERLIDIDILYFNDEIIEEKDLVIPHPEIQNRRFVLEPMVEIGADQIHPVIGQTQRELFSLCSDQLSTELKI